MTSIQQPTSPPPLSPSPMAAPAPLHWPSGPLPLPSTLSRPTSPLQPLPSTPSRPSSPSSTDRSRAEQSLLYVLERETANRALSPGSRTGSPGPTTRRRHRLRARNGRERELERAKRDSVIFDVDLATLVERSIALQSTSATIPRDLPPSPPTTCPASRLASSSSSPKKRGKYFSTSPSVPSPLLTDSDSDSQPECDQDPTAHSRGPSVLRARASTNSKEKVRRRRATNPEHRKLGPLTWTQQPVQASFPPTPSDRESELGLGLGLGLAIGMGVGVGVAMGGGKVPVPPSPPLVQASRPPSRPGTPLVQPPTPAFPLQAPQARRPSASSRLAIKRAPSPAHPPRASNAALAAAVTAGSPLSPPLQRAKSPLPRPTTPTPRSSSGSTVGSPQRPGHTRHDSAGTSTPTASSRISGIQPMLRATSLESDASFPSSMAGPLLSPPALEEEALSFDFDRATRRLKNTAGRVCFDDILTPPLGDEEEPERPRLSGRRWSLWN